MNIAYRIREIYLTLLILFKELQSVILLILHRCALITVFTSVWSLLQFMINEN